MLRRRGVHEIAPAPKAQCTFYRFCPPVTTGLFSLSCIVRITVLYRTDDIDDRKEYVNEFRVEV